MSAPEITTEAEFTEAVAALQKAAAAYYDTDTLLMSDSEFDALADAVEAAHRDHPDWDDAGVTTAVAAGASAGGTIVHPRPMLSMSKATDTAVVDEFVTATGVAMCVEPKLDGLALRASYIDGRLSSLVTRGDGISGEPIDFVALAITGLPATLTTAATLEVRGEAYMSAADFDTSNRNRIAAGKPGFANPRNAVAGTIRRATVTYQASLSFAAYDADGDTLDALDSYLDRMASLAALGVAVVPAKLAQVGIALDATTDPATINARIAELGRLRAELDFGIDGAVVKADSYAARARLGAGSRAPKWAIAFKYPPAEATSYLAAVDVAVGRSGRMSLTGIIDPPVHLDGSTVTRATLHNPAFIAEHGLGIGSRVLVTRRGDVIPRITAALGERDTSIAVWTPPAVHDVCGAPWNTSEVIWRCESPECSVAAKIAYFASRDVMDIDGLGVEMATAFADSGLVSNVGDLYSLTADQIAEVPIGTTSTGAPRRVGPTVAAKIVAGIDASKSQSLPRIVTSLGLGKMGRTMGRRVAAHFRTLDAIRAASVDDFCAVDGVAEEKAASYVTGFAAMSDVLDVMVAAGVTTSMETADSAPSAPLAGMKVVVTGSMAGTRLHGLNRTQMAELIEAAGGTASGSVSKATSLLVCGEPGSAKYVKAVSLGVPIATPDEFAATVAEHLQ